MSFDYLGLSDELLSAVRDAGYTEPTPIQKKTIPSTLQGRDILGIAQTGTGKTASFTLPMIDILAQGRARARMPRSLILEPTRELAAQVEESFDKYGKNSKLTCALLIGGTDFAGQVKKLDKGVDVLIATPGRLIDHCERGKVILKDAKIIVIPAIATHNRGLAVLFRIIFCSSIGIPVVITLKRFCRTLMLIELKVNKQKMQT